MTVASRLAERRTALAGALAGLERSSASIEAAVDDLVDALRSGGRVLVAGNGGSAMEAQHLTGELVGRLSPPRERGALAGIALTADTGILTALANDYGYDQVFARQVEALGQPGDVLMVLSTSGASSNCVEAVAEAKRRSMRSIGLLGGEPRALHDACDIAIAVPATDIPTVQECHLVIIHLLVELVEDRLVAAQRPETDR